MRLFRHFEETPDAIRGGALALGNFDGMHRGHRAVMEAARAAGRAVGTSWGVMTFEPHPRAVLGPAPDPFRLTPMRVKARLIEELGADFLLMQHFDLAFAARTAEDFVAEVLVGALAVRHVVVGYDFVFGHKRRGDVALLRHLAQARGFEATSLAPVADDAGEPFSSTRAREALLGGRPGEAARVLGRPWEIEGRVEHGDGRGAGLGFPTANIVLGDSLRPAAGVYAVRVGIERHGLTHWHPGVAYCGPRPTFDKTETVLEAHLFDYSGDLYARHLRVALIEFLRPDRRFADVTALAAQMEQDARAARELLFAPVAHEAGT